MSEFDEEYYEPKPIILQLIESLQEELQKLKCKLYGHIFDHEKPLKNPHNKREIIVQECKCGESKYVWSDTGESVSKEVIHQRLGEIIYWYTKRDGEVYALIPKTIFHKNYKCLCGRKLGQGVMPLQNLVCPDCGEVNEVGEVKNK